MTNFNYATYTCSVCKRSKDFIRDDKRVLPASCSITKSCTGTLHKTGQKLIAENTLPSSTVRDWYPRGKKPVVSNLVKADPGFSLSCDVDGTMFLAVASSNPEDRVVLRVTKSVPTDVEYQRYLFIPSAPQTILSGRDSQNRVLRFDLAAISEGRVAVRVNGVLRNPGAGVDDIVLTPNTVVFNSPVAFGSNIDVSVYLVQITTSENITFAPNNEGQSGAWGNVRWFNRYDADGQLSPDKWWVYNTRLSLKNSASLRIDSLDDADGNVLYSGAGLSNVIFLTAGQPFEHVDRLTSFFLSCDSLESEFNVNAVKDGTSHFSVDNKFMTETYPPIPLNDGTISFSSSFISKNVVKTLTGKIFSDTTVVRRTGKKIIGPV